MCAKQHLPGSPANAPAKGVHLHPPRLALQGETAHFFVVVFVRVGDSCDSNSQHAPYTPFNSCLCADVTTPSILQILQYKERKRE